MKQAKLKLKLNKTSFATPPIASGHPALGTPITTKEACTLTALKWANIINYKWELAISRVMRDRDSHWCNKTEQGKWAVTQCGDYQWDCRQWSAWYSWTSRLNNTATAPTSSDIYVWTPQFPGTSSLSVIKGMKWLSSTLGEREQLCNKVPK